MSMTQFLQILYAGRWRLLLCIVACVGAALAFGSRLPPSYEARARVILELVSPDLVTGTEVNAKSTESYVRTQQLLAMSERVALRAIEKLGWPENPAVIDAWNGATGGAGDIRVWAARRIMADTGAVPLEGGGTMEIIYRAPDPDAARQIAGVIRESYIETVLELQTESAKRRADRYDELEKQARARVTAAEAAYTGLQRATGIVADGNGADLESGALQRLQANELAAAATEPEGARPAAQLSSLMLRKELAALEQQVALAVTQLGPANPEYQSLLARRDARRAALARAMASAPSGGGGIAAARRLRAETMAAYREERTRILGRGPDMLRLAQALRQVTVLRADLERIMRNGAELRMQSERTQSGLVVMGDVLTKDEPVAPNLPLIAALAAMFGIALGFVAVMLDGLLRREVLGAADLEFASGVPVLGVVPAGPRGPWQARWMSMWAALRARVRRRALASA